MKENDSLHQADPPARKRRGGKGTPSGDGSSHRHPKTSEPTAASHQGQQADRGSERPVTNQDEQRKTTNVGNSDEPMGEQETEGDSCRYRFAPCPTAMLQYGLPERTHPAM